MPSASEVFAVILAGGSGTRFWPASRRLRPKQLLPLGGDGKTSLLAATVARLTPLLPPEQVLIATGAHLVAATRTELPSLPESSFLAEPAAKNTAPCIGWATEVAFARNPEAVVVVLPSDQHATDEREFRRVLEAAIQEARRGRIVTVGVVPSRPETGYGYIKKGPGTQGEAFAVDSFKEKPDPETAAHYVASGDYLWNAGMFIFQAQTMRQAFREHLPGMTPGLDGIQHALSRGEGVAAAIESFFREAEAISIDHGVMEKCDRLSVVAGDFGWTDLGSWESLWESQSKDSADNAARSGDLVLEGARNLIVDLRSSGARAQDSAVALLGVDDLCVVLTDDGVLVIPRERSQDVRSIVQMLKEQGREALL